MTRSTSESICTINRAIAPINDVVRATNPDAIDAPKVTDMLTVYDLGAEAHHLILVRRLDFRPKPRLPVGDVVVFSKPAFAPCRTERLQLATPGYYRGHESLEPGIRDRQDGTLTKDGSAWASKVMGGPVSARVEFVSEGEPWVYCSSHCRSSGDLRRLRSEFDASYGYATATSIVDPSEFAAHLGVDFALGLDKATDLSLGPLDEIVYAGSNYATNLWEGHRPIDTVVHVYHGPVNYEDVSGSVYDGEGWFDPNAGPLAWFTKRTSFRDQCEYRFAISSIGSPANPKHYVAVSPELRSLAVEV